MKASINFLEGILSQHKDALRCKMYQDVCPEKVGLGKRQFVLDIISDLEECIKILNYHKSFMEKGLVSDSQDVETPPIGHSDILEALRENVHYVLTGGDEISDEDVKLVKFYFKQHKRASKAPKLEMDFELAKSRLMDAIFGEDLDSEKEGDVRGSELYTESDMIDFSNAMLSKIDSTDKFIVGEPDLKDFNIYKNAPFK